MEHFATTVALIGIVIVVASLLSGVLDRSRVPLVAVFLLLGAVLGPWGIGVLDITLASPSLQVLATLALALVLFSDAVTLETAALRSHKRLAWRLIGPGTLMPAVLTAFAAWLLLDVSAPAAAILGAALASTDPVLLRSVLRGRALPDTTRLALRFETGTNDVVLLPIVALAILVIRAAGAAGGVEGREIARSLLGLFLLGPALGALVGWVGITALVKVRTRVGVRRDYESLYALGLAFTGYAVAEAVGGSGFLAAFAAGFMVAVQDVELCDCFLEYGEATAEMLLLLTFVAFGASLIWTGLTVIDLPTILFAAIALSARTVVLFPMLAGLGLGARDRKLIALFGPRGLSALLLTLLPVFAGVPNAERLFTVTCLVVLLSVLVHGTGIALFLRAGSSVPGGPNPTATVAASVRAPRGGLPMLPVDSAHDASNADRIRIDEVRELQARGETVVLADARADRSYRVDDIQAAGAVRLPPDDPVRAARSLGLAQHATVVVYCA